MTAGLSDWRASAGASATGLRFELEGNYRQNKLSHWNGTPFPANAHGKNETYGPMVNALYDFYLGWPVVPYVGVGAGYAWTQLNSFSKRA